MPELPEVETIVRGLSARITGKMITSVRVLDKRYQGQDLKQLVSRNIISVSRRGKYILVDVGLNDSLCFHMRMTGQLKYMDDLEENKHTRVVFGLDQGWLVLEDLRRFATVELVTVASICKKLGPEPLSSEFTPEHLYRKSRNRKIPVKTFLLDQKAVAGIGNIYASEILFDCRIDPQKQAGEISRKDAEKIVGSTRKILEQACELRGTTFSDYRDSDGKKGSYQDCLKVFRKENQNCPRCGSCINRIKQQQRSTFFCPECQK